MTRTRLYREMSVNTARPEEIILLLYDSFLTNAHRAVVRQEAKDLQGVNVAIKRCQNILFELISSLDKSAATDLGNDLELAYRRISKSLLRAQASGDATRYRDAIEAMQSIRDGWKAALEQLRKSDEDGDQSAANG
jgi:flagellar secretion chaperone FliS